MCSKTKRLDAGQALLGTLMRLDGKLMSPSSSGKTSTATAKAKESNQLKCQKIYADDNG